MTTGDEIFRRLQSAARSTASKEGTAAPTQEYLTRHVLESFLDRLTRTPHAEDFILKGGILLAAYGFRRPTKDADANAVNVDVTVDHLTNVVRDIAEVSVDDGVIFNLDTISVQPPRAGPCIDRHLERGRGVGRIRRRADRAPTPTGDYRPDPRRSNRAPRLCVRDHDRRERGDDPRTRHHQSEIAISVPGNLANDRNWRRRCAAMARNWREIRADAVAQGRLAAIRK